MDPSNSPVPRATVSSPNNTVSLQESSVWNVSLPEGVVEANGFHNISESLGLHQINQSSVTDGKEDDLDNDVIHIDETDYFETQPLTRSLPSTRLEFSKTSDISLSRDVSTKHSHIKRKQTKSASATHCFTNHSKFQETAAVKTLNLNLNLPPLKETVTLGFGVKMVASTSSSSANCQQLIYRSVPARPLSYTLTDVMDTKGPKLRSKTAPVSTNTPEEFAQRFKSRPTTRPKVIEFDGSCVSSKTKRAGMGSAFPTARAKIYIGHPKSGSAHFTELSQPKPTGSRLQLAPLTTIGPPMSPGPTSSSSRTQRGLDKAPSLTGHHHKARMLSKSAQSIHGQTTKSTTSLQLSENLRETTQSADLRTSIQRQDSPQPDDHIHNPDLLLSPSNDLDDLSILPRPKKVLPKREVPWVFRYKVKRGMNTLSRIMASRPAQTVLHSSYTFT